MDHRGHHRGWRHLVVHAAPADLIRRPGVIRRASLVTAAAIAAFNPKEIESSSREAVCVDGVQGAQQR
jgi:hypothetical protein